MATKELKDLKKFNASETMRWYQRNGNGIECPNCKLAGYAEAAELSDDVYTQMPAQFPPLIKVRCMRCNYSSHRVANVPSDRTGYGANIRLLTAHEQGAN